MKKLNKLFAILIAVLGVGSLSAQTDVTSTYLTNAGFDDGTNGWTEANSGNWTTGGFAAYGSSTAINDVTNVSVDKFGKSEGSAIHTSASWEGKRTYTQEVTFPAGEYKITFDVINRNTATKHNIVNYFGWIPSNGGDAIYSSVTNIAYNVWYTLSVSFTLTTQTTGKISVGMGAAAAGAADNAKLFIDNVRIFKMDEASSPTIANPIDYSDLINQSTWSYAEDDGSGSSSSLTTNVTKGEWPYRMTERYRGAAGHYGKKLYQTVSVPAGVYQVQAACMSAHANGVEGSNALADGTLNNAYFYANEEEVTYSLANATSSFQKHIVTLTEDGSIEFGVKTVAVGANWNAIGCATLIKVANNEDEYWTDFLGELYTTKKALVEELSAYDEDNLPDAYYTIVTSAIEEANAANTQETLSEVNEKLTNIKSVISAISNAYLIVSDKINECETYVAADYSIVKTDDVRTTFSSAITKAKTDVEEKTTADDVNAVYATLEAARQEYVKVAYPTDGNSFDMTFKITNPSFETGDATGWKVINSSDTGVKPNSNATYATSGVDGNYLFNNYWQGTPLTQALSNMPNGIYELKVLVASDGCTVYLIADDEHNEGTDTYTTGKGQFVEATMTFTCTDGNVVIGVVGGANGDASAHKGFTANGYWWYKADNFRLTRTFNTTDMQSALTDLLTEANTIANQPMDANIKEALNSTIQATDATATDPATLDDMINALTEAMASAEASINDYAKLKKYIDMTAVFTDVSTYQAKYNNAEYSSEDVETVRRELNVMRFNAASLIFTNNIEVTGWEGTMGGKNTSSQHWDGTTTTKYYDNNSWNGTAHSTTTNITLPAGNYVLKAALRSSANTTLRLTVLDETVNVEGKGDQGYGITINGTASFSPNSTYANDNNGRGWEWEFVKFELADETTVTLTVECDYNGVYGWASFSDITLWMDDATYVAVYGKELDAPLAEAKTLVNTLPMGDAENTALAEAIAIGESELSSPTELNAAVDGLKTAVANANAWRSTYNTEKDKLVTALERFETEFNDGTNGALRFIVEWDELLTAVAEAACAKDATNSYDKFSNAAATLNAAMDAVFEDYLKYEMLEDYTSVIGNADCASNDAWPGSGRDNDTKEHWSGTEKTYFKQNHENGAARTQTVTLPKSGTYLLKAAVRAVEAASYVDIIINGKSHKIMGAHGRTGGTIATDGTEWESVAAGIEAGKTFANGNKGYGWVYQYIYFDAEVGENTIAISLSNYNNNREANVGGMTLYYLRPNYTEEENNVVKHYGEYNEFVVTTTTHDITAATMSNISVDFTANPNALIFANEGQVSNESNVIINGTANQLSLTDGYAFNATTDFTANAASYGREFTKDTWLTVCLPFAYTIPEGVKVETLGAIDLDTKTFTFDEVKDEMEANKPYIIKNNTEAAALLATLNDVAVKATPAKMDVTITAGNSTHKGEFIGTYTTVSTDDLMEEGAYDILFFGTDGQLYYLSSGTTTKVVTINPFRAYIRLPKDAINWSDGQKARVRHRTSESTDIEDSQSADHDSGLIYDLQGRRVLNPTKGMYIVNGEKVLF